MLRLGHGLRALRGMGRGRLARHDLLEGGRVDLLRGQRRHRRVRRQGGHPRRRHGEQWDRSSRHIWHYCLAGQDQRRHGCVGKVDGLHGEGGRVGRHGQRGVHGQAGQQHGWSKVLRGSWDGGHVCSRYVGEGWRKAVKSCQRSNCRNDRKLRNLKKI